MEGVRRRLTLSEQMSILDSSNLRDLLRVRDDDIDDGRNALAGLTLGAVLGCEEIIRPNNHHQPSRTLLDIIKDEESGAAYRGIDVVIDNTQNGINNNNKQKSWKSFKDRLRLRRAGAAWSSSSSSHHHHPISDDCDDDDNDCRLEISGPTLTGIQRSSFSLVPSRSSVPVQNVTDFDERETSTVEEEEEINTGTGGSSSDGIAVTNNSVPSEPVVMRLSAALAAEREEQRQQASQLEEERESTETQLVEERESIETQLGEERESPIEVAEQQEEDHQQQNHSRNEELGIDQRGIGVISAGQQHQNQSRNEEMGIDQRGVGLVISTGQQQQQQNQSRNEEMGIDQRGVGVVSTGQQQQQPLRVSLMALLEETMDHRQNELILLDEEEEEMVGGGGEDQVIGMMVERERGGKNDEYICCVCMVRHKGAAFIPCGHTFCRLCSRKLWVNRGNCPLCNGFILEILDIF